MNHKLALLSGACLFSLVTGSALAQQGGLVNVNIANNDILNNIGIVVQDTIDLQQTNLTVQVPVGIAAQVCGVTANVIAKNKSATACTLDQAQDNEAFTNQLLNNREEIEASLTQLAG